MLSCILALALVFSLSACRRTDVLDDALGATPGAPTPEPSMVPIYATAQPDEATATQSPVVAVSAQDPTPEATPETPATDAPINDPPIATPNPEPTSAPTAEPTIADTYGYSSINNTKLRVKFAYPDTWTSNPGTDTICFQEPVEEGDVPAQISVSSFTYPEAKVTTKRLKGHLQTVLQGIVDEYNEYQLGSVDSASFVGSAGLSATYIAVKGDSYIRGYVVVGYAKNERVYMMHFCCEESDFETFGPLITKLAENISPQL